MPYHQHEKFKNQGEALSRKSIHERKIYSYCNREKYYILIKQSKISSKKHHEMVELIGINNYLNLKSSKYQDKTCTLK